MRSPLSFFLLWELRFVGLTCNLCGLDQPLDEFSRRSDGTRRKDCRTCKQTRYLMKNYGITRAEYQRLYESQKGRCFICKRSSQPSGDALAVDHDHQTGKIRGLLCHSCNMKMSWFEKYSSRIVGYL